MTDPADLSALAARRLIGRRALSPVELAEACVARLDAVNPAVNAVVALDRDRVMAEARAAEAAVARGEALGPLHGLPVAIKDMTDVAGLPTTFGCTLFRDNLAVADDPIVVALRAAGAGMLGKTNVPEFSAGANTINAVYGVTANPHDLTKNAAGSSGGSAVALACGMAPLATGSDMGGSLRNPAAYCGVVGFRPSPGVVPSPASRTAILPLATSGPMGRTVADAALMLSVMARPDGRDPYTAVVGGRTIWAPEGFGRLPRRDLAALRLAMTEDYGFAPTEGIVRRAFRARAAHLAPLFGRAEEGTPDCQDADRIFAVLRGLSYLVDHHANVVGHPGVFGPNIVANVEEGLGYSALDVARALAAHSEYFRRWQAFFAEWDYLICPAVTVSPRDWHELYPREIDGAATKSYYHWLALAYASTLAGHPSISIPMGRDETGLPFGLQIVGRRNDDLGVLAVAAEIEAALAGDAAFGVPRVDLAALKAAPPLAEAPGFWPDQPKR
jgi:amidase